MARTFVRASSQHCSIASALVTVHPLTLAAWIRPSTSNTTQDILTITDGAGAANGWLLRQTSSATIQALSDAGGTFDSSTTTGTVTNGTWSHAAAVFASATSRKAYLDGTVATENTTNISPGSLSDTRVGAAFGPQNFYDGDIAEAAIWNVALDAAEIAALAKGISPFLIRPASLIAYWPLFGNNSPEIDRWKNKSDLTVTGATKGAHPRQYYPASILPGTQVVFAKTLSATQGQTATLSTIKTFVKALSAVQGQLATLVKQVSKILSVSESTSPTLFTDRVALPSTSDTGVNASTGATTAAVTPPAQPYRLDWPQTESIDRAGPMLAQRMHEADQMFDEVYDALKRVSSSSSSSGTTKVQPWDVDLDGLSALTTFGFLVRSGIGVFDTRRLLAGPGINISNNLGTSGDPQISAVTGSVLQAWSAFLDALAALSSNGILARTGAGTVAARTITAGSGITVSNGDGVSGNPTISHSFTIDSGTYTPTLTGVANIDSVTAYLSQYIRIGNIVHVFGTLDADATAVTTQTQVRISLPIASNIAATTDVAGLASAGYDNGVVRQTGRIFGDATNDAALFDYSAESAVLNVRFGFSFSYRVL